MTIYIPPLRWWEKVADVLMVPIMYVVSGTLREAPQQTHFWNNKKFLNSELVYLNQDLLLHIDEVVKARNPWFFSYIPLFHLPIFGGWKEYVVIEPEEDIFWHIGWYVDGISFGASKLAISGPVRVLVGPKPTKFFGLDSLGRQIKIKKIGVGTIGSLGEYSQVPLF